MKPVILTTADFVNLPRASALVVKSEYAKRITAAGGIAVSPSSVPHAEDYARFADALLLTDGPVVHSSRYGGCDRMKPPGLDTQRDDLDFALCHAFLKAGKPILGIGRGAQVLNVALGGTLGDCRTCLIVDGQYTNLRPGEYFVHNQPRQRLNHAFGNHPIHVTGSTLLENGDRVVNSYHRQAAVKLGYGLTVTATAPDGTVEAFEDAGRHLFGVQFHPEHAYDDYPGDDGLFRKFVDCARSFAREPRPRTACAAIAVNGGGTLDPDFEMPGWVMCHTYLNAVAAGGGMPILTIDPDSAADYAEIADGLVMTGAFSWAPRPAVALRAGVEAGSKRHLMDRGLFEGFKALKKPIFGICLGHQMMNLYSGGSISCFFKNKVGNEHMMSEHMCKAQPGSLLYRLFGETFMVNSRHNNRIERLAEGFKVTAMAAQDDTIEAIEHETLPIYGFQFHPERTRGDQPDPPAGPDSTPLFRELSRMALEHRH